MKRGIRDGDGSSKEGMKIDKKKNAYHVKAKQGWTSADSECDPSWRSLDLGALKIAPQGVTNPTGRVGTDVHKYGGKTLRPPYLSDTTDDKIIITCIFC